MTSHERIGLKLVEMEKLKLKVAAELNALMGAISFAKQELADLEADAKAVPNVVNSGDTGSSTSE